ncbi:hypothetical protein M011DRAFT_104997 [Sporormia fimetaria CBS 119925]|uniref:Glucose-inducible SAM-dependent methyltransferase Rrg1 n=1 Tax=Sporormia fimetaria CBS 119925 TaxID=1340428 RepID=A0A6A6VN72_9PLEO|nr:hypothetical protein M011DRAFT_104997 [Sporormia fimetaria CBS 119925]
MALLDVLDLPQLYTKPSAETLLDTLSLLTSAPPSWEPSDHEDQSDGERTPDRRRIARSRAPPINPEGVTRYLTNIVSSSLRWIPEEEMKEEIWIQASARLSERAGRTGMGALSRTFRIPSPNGQFELSIHEPALTGDDLGLKTWAASYMLAKRLHRFDFLRPEGNSKLSVLELGSGTGLVGLAMAALGADVVLTDLPSIYTNLARNARDNSDVIRQGKGSARCGVLDWTEPSICRLLPEGSDVNDEGCPLNTKFPVILAADSLYSPEHPRWLVHTVSEWLSPDPEAKVIVEFPLRDAYLPEVKDFRERMAGIGLQIVKEGEERGYDDWGSANQDDSDAGLVRCWWSCWGRKSA